MRITWVLLILIQLNFNPARTRRNKRTLIYIPPGGIVQVIMGVGLPLVLNDESIIVGFVTKAAYHLPYNSTQITNPGITFVKKKRDISRWDLYGVMAEIAEMNGLGGKECILRAICEISNSPLHNNGGLLEELMHTIFTPSSTREVVKRHADNIYHSAEQLGKSFEAACELFFPECQVNLVEMFTKLHRF